MQESGAGRTCKCPTCGKEFACGEGQPKPACFPFCSERCQWIDLGKWLSDKYRISEDLPPGEEKK